MLAGMEFGNGSGGLYLCPVCGIGGIEVFENCVVREHGAVDTYIQIRIGALMEESVSLKERDITTAGEFWKEENMGCLT